MIHVAIATSERERTQLRVISLESGSGAHDPRAVGPGKARRLGLCAPDGAVGQADRHLRSG